MIPPTSAASLPGMTPTLSRALAAVAAHGLPGHGGGPITVDSHDELLVRADTQRIAVHLDAAVESGRFPDADERWSAQVRERALAAAEKTLNAHASAARARRRLSVADVPAVVLKGCSTGHLDYPRPVDRFSSDVDLLVPRSRLAVATDALGRVGDDVVRSARWHRRFGHATTVIDDRGVEIDVHVLVDHGYVGLAVPTDQLVADVEDFTIGDERLHALGPARRLVVAAVHVNGPQRSLHAVRDVPQLVLVGGVDWEEAVELAERWRIDSFVAHGVRTAWRALDLDPHPISEWAHAHVPAGRQRIVSGLPEGGARRQVAAGPLALPVRDWPGYLVPLLFPSPAYVRKTGKGWKERGAIVGRELWP